MNKLHVYIIVVVSFLSTCFVYSDDSQPKSIPCRTAHNGMIDIQKVMDYPIPHVIARFCKEHHVSKEDAKIYEKELKRYFILAGAYPEDHLSMLSSNVDNLWHTFILFTVDYQKFCNEMFGRFIHHVPKIDIHKLIQESGIWQSGRPKFESGKAVGEAARVQAHVRCSRIQS